MTSAKKNIFYVVSIIITLFFSFKRHSYIYKYYCLTTLGQASEMSFSVVIFIIPKKQTEMILFWIVTCINGRKYT